MTKKPEVIDIFFEAFNYQFSAIFLFLTFTIFLSSLCILALSYFDKDTEKEALKKEIKFFKFGTLISFIFLFISFSIFWNDAKSYLENNDKFLSLETNREWFLENTNTIYSQLEPKEYDIYEIISFDEITKKEGKIYLDEKLAQPTGKDLVMIDYINSLDKGILFYVKALIINEEKEIEKITFYANLKVDDKNLVEKAVLYNTNDSKEDIGLNFMFGEININKNE